jgi:hypothetical protein
MEEHKVIAYLVKITRNYAIYQADSGDVIHYRKLTTFVGEPPPSLNVSSEAGAHRPSFGKSIGRA